jgi:glycosyltransferase involved in cell wall biosynthesis
MTFSVDAHAIGCHLTGNEVYIRNLLDQFARIDKQSHFITYLAKADAFESVPGRFTKYQVAENPFVRLGIDLPRRVWQDRPALLHVQYTAPVYCAAPVVTTVHDVSFLEHPEFFTPFRARQLRLTVARTVRRAAKVLTPSEFSKRAIMRAYGVPEEKIEVTPNAVSPHFRPLSREGSAQWIADRFGYRNPIVLTVGDLQPRKNHLRLIEAFASLLRENPRIPHDLVLAGKSTWYEPEIRRAAVKSGFANRIHFTGWVSDEDLLRLYGACEVFVFPSLYEGFGIPILEAMACGRAVACSGITAMPEVANGAGLFFDPYSVREMALVLRDLLRDPQLRQTMERHGERRAADFSWSRTAERTLAVYYEVAGVTVGLPAESRVGVPHR